MIDKLPSDSPIRSFIAITSQFNPDLLAEILVDLNEIAEALKASILYEVIILN